MIYPLNIIENSKTRVISILFLCETNLAGDCIEQKCRGCGGEQCQLCREDAKTIETCVSGCVESSCKGCGGAEGMARGSVGFLKSLGSSPWGFNIFQYVPIVKRSIWMIWGYCHFWRIPHEFPFKSHFPRRNSTRRAVPAVPRGCEDHPELLRELRGPHVQGWKKL